MNLIPTIPPIHEQKFTDDAHRRRDIAHAKLFDYILGRLNGVTVPGGTTIIQNITQGGAGGGASSSPLLRNFSDLTLSPGRIYGIDPVSGKIALSYVKPVANLDTMIWPEIAVSESVAPGANFAPAGCTVLLLRLKGGQSPTFPYGDRRAWLSITDSEPGTVVVGSPPAISLKVPLGRIWAPPDRDGNVLVVKPIWEVE